MENFKNFLRIIDNALNGQNDALSIETVLSNLDRFEVVVTVQFDDGGETNPEYAEESLADYVQEKNIDRSSSFGKQMQRLSDNGVTFKFQHDGYPHYTVIYAGEFIEKDEKENLDE